MSHSYKQVSKVIGQLLSALVAEANITPRIFVMHLLLLHLWGSTAGATRALEARTLTHALVVIGRAGKHSIPGKP